MNERGLMTISVPIKIILGVLVVLAVFFLFPKVLNAIGSVIPTFGESSFERKNVHTIGYNLEDGKLYYYDAIEWVAFRDEVLQLGNYGAVKREEALNAFLDFHVSTNRFNFLLPPDAQRLFGRHGPNSFYLDDFSTLRAEMYVINQEVVTVIQRTIDPPYLAYPDTEETVYLDYTNKLFTIKPNNGAKDFLSRDSKYHTQQDYQEVLARIIAWRDSVLEGKPNEKYFTLNGKYFTVRAIDEYLVVDLDKAVNVAERPAKFDTVSPGISEDRSDWITSVQRVDFFISSEGYAWVSAQYALEKGALFSQLATSREEGWYVVCGQELCPLADFADATLFFDRSPDLMDGLARIGRAREGEEIHIEFRSLNDPLDGVSELLRLDIKEVDEETFTSEFILGYNSLFAPPGEA